MNKRSLILNSLIASAFSLVFISCENGTNTKSKPKASDIDTSLSASIDTSSAKAATVPSLTKKEAEAKMKAFLKENSKKYREYGELQEMNLIGGNYDQDGGLDYFYKLSFYPGGDFVYPYHFFYDSKEGKIRELVLNKPTSNMQSIDAKEIKEGKIIGNASIFSALNVEIDAFRNVAAEFTIDGNKINCDKKFTPKLKKAEKEIANELAAKEREMMENADAYNSEEVAE